MIRRDKRSQVFRAWATRNSTPSPPNKISQVKSADPIATAYRCQPSSGAAA